jgi:hypothetical protein
MFGKDFIKELIQDNGGQVFSLDSMFALIIITVILGLSANAMDLVNFQIDDYSSEKFLERITTDAATTLINTPGSPDKWEINNLSGYEVMPGLAEVDSEGKIVPNTLSIKKIRGLQSAYSELMGGKIIPYGIHSNVVLYPVDHSLSPIVLNNETPPGDAVEVAVVNRTVLCDSMILSTLITINTSGSSSNYENRSFVDICPHKTLKLEMEHQNLNYGGPSWACRYFKISQEDLNSTDFYIITDPETLGGTSNQWIIDKTDNMTNERQNFNPGPLLINNKISQVLGQDKKAVLWLHVTFTSSTPSFGVYLVGAPKGTPIDNVKLEYVNPRPYFFVLKVWR